MSNLAEPDNISYSDFDINSCWVCDENISNTENYIYSSISTGDKAPAINIKNNDGEYELRFKKGSIVRFSAKQLWYNKADLILIVKINRNK